MIARIVRLPDQAHPERHGADFELAAVGHRLHVLNRRTVEVGAVAGVQIVDPRPAIPERKDTLSPGDVGEVQPVIALRVPANHAREGAQDQRVGTNHRLAGNPLKAAEVDLRHRYRRVVPLGAWLLRGRGTRAWSGRSWFGPNASLGADHQSGKSLTNAQTDQDDGRIRREVPRHVTNRAEHHAAEPKPQAPADPVNSPGAPRLPISGRAGSGD